MLVTDDTTLFERAQFLRDHGRCPGDKMFFNHEVAYKYKMSSMQAALGLAQLERVEELLAQKRRIDVPRPLASPELLDWLKPRVVALGVICIFISLWARRSVAMQTASGKSMGFEVSSYLSLFSLSLVGVAILIAALWKSRAFRSGGETFGAALLFAAIIFLTFQPGMRFQFLG